MNAQRTLLIIKPDTIKHELDVLHTITSKGYHILNKERLQLTEEQITEAFSEYYSPSEFNSVVEFYKSGPIHVLIIEKINAIADTKTLLGPNDPAVARDTAPESLRAKFGTDLIKNGFHCSETADQAEKEIRFFFPGVFVEPICAPNCNKNFLNNEVYPVLTQGLTQLCKQKPSNPIEYLGKWLLENNPNVPKAIV